MRSIIYIGKKFGNFTVIDSAERAENGTARWLCRCVCGKEIILPSYTIRKGKKTDCGCITTRHYNATHNGSNTPLYNMWKLMLYRCENPKNHAFKDYGMRGITVCEEWHDFLAFKKWVDETRESEDLTIDRIDNNKGYSPSNCRWASKKVQSNNRRSNIKFEYNGEIHDLAEWSEILGFDYKRVHNRISKLGWTFERAISEPVNVNKRNKAQRRKYE